WAGGAVRSVRGSGANGPGPRTSGVAPGSRSGPGGPGGAEPPGTTRPRPRGLQFQAGGGALGGLALHPLGVLALDLGGALLGGGAFGALVLGHLLPPQLALFGRGQLDAVLVLEALVVGGAGLDGVAAQHVVPLLAVQGVQLLAGQAVLEGDRLHPRQRGLVALALGVGQVLAHVLVLSLRPQTVGLGAGLVGPVHGLAQPVADLFGLGAGGLGGGALQQQPDPAGVVGTVAGGLGLLAQLGQRRLQLGRAAIEFGDLVGDGLAVRALPGVDLLQSERPP